jgi:hypothetical protein
MSKTSQIPPGMIQYTEPEVRKSLEDGVNQAVAFSNFYKEFTKPAPKDRYVYMPYATTAAGINPPGYPTTKKYRKEDAAFLSNIAMFHPIGGRVGGAIKLMGQLPDFLYDVDDIKENPKDWRNYAHVGLDIGNPLSKWTPTKYDNFLQRLGFIDDVFGSQGIDMLPEEFPFKVIQLPPATVTPYNEATLQHNKKTNKKLLGGASQTNNKFSKWIRSIADMRGWNVNEMLNDPTYNYRHFYDTQPLEAERMLRDAADAHFTDVAKTAYHPTFSDESDYSGRLSVFNPRGIVGGTWTDAPRLGKHGSRYTLSNSQMRNGWDVGRTIDYVSFNEPNGAEVRLPNGTMPRYDGAYFDAVLPTIEIIGKRKKNK